MQYSKYLKQKNNNIADDSKYISLFCQIEIILIAILYVYACWYVQTFVEIGLVVKGVSILILVFMLLDIYFEDNGKINLELIPKGMIVNLCLSPYFLLTGFIVAYNFSVLLNSLIIYTGYTVAGIAICYVSSKKQSIDWFMKIVIFTALLCGIYALIAGDRYYGYGLRLSVRNNIHTFALVLVMGIFALAYRSKNTLASLLFHSALASFLYYCIVESSSRKCFIAASLIIVLWLCTALLFILKRRNDILSQIFIVAIIAGLFILTYTRFTVFFETSKTFKRFQSFTEEDSNGARIEMYRKAFSIFLEKPLFGGGFDQYQFWSGIGSYSHATYAEAIADFGLIGSLIYFLPIIVVGWRLFSLSFFDSKTYISRITFILYLSELFIGVGQIFFLSTVHMFVFPIMYWVAMFETSRFIEHNKQVVVSN